MKKVFKLIGTTLFISFLAISCSSKSETQNAENPNETKNETQKVDSLKEVKVEEEVEKIEPAKVTCKIFFLSDDFSDEETGEFIKGTVGERETFRTNKSYTYCYDSESFNHLTIDGKGNVLNFKVKQDGKIIFKKENFELTKSLKFTEKDLEIGMGSVYTFEISQKDKILFSGKIDSQGCM